MAEDARDGTSLVSLPRARPLGERRDLGQHDGGRGGARRLRRRYGAPAGQSGRAGMPHRRRVVLFQCPRLIARLCSSLYTHALVAKNVKAAVAGANGYAGMTAVHLLAGHPNVALTQLTSRSFAGQRYSEIFPLLALQADFSPQPSIDGIDCMFDCL